MTHINYLQAKKNYTILHSISEILKKNKLEGADSLTSLADKSISKQGFFEVIDRESPTTGVWVLDWDIYNSIINEISSIAREVDQGASSRL